MIVSDGSQPPPDAANTYVPSACPGGRAPHAGLEDGVSPCTTCSDFEWTLLQVRTSVVSASGQLLGEALRGLGGRC